MDRVKEVMMNRLEDKGLAPAEITLFIRDVARSFTEGSYTGLQEINRRLHALGWENIEMDDHTMQLIIAGFEAEEEAGD
ncbi:MAG: hypothetical protein ABII68_01910 [Pseudomonadota bacterium]